MTAVAVRRRYQGVLQIVSFNRGMYLAVFSAVGAASILFPFLGRGQRLGLAAALAPALFWIVASLAASHYVYDRSSLYDLDWLLSALARPVQSWINIHAGWDESSARLHSLLPHACGQVADIFDANRMTEHSIQRARRRNSAPAIAAHYDALPFGNSSFDTAFCIFAAHELRHHHERVRLFSQIARILSSEGQLILVEHVRDGRNFLAFGPGFLHFFSRSEWRRTACEGGLTLQTEFPFTPFVRVFIFGKGV
jgi:SAM-dependent methyltransferase